MNKNVFIHTYSLIIHSSQSVETPKCPSADAQTKYGTATQWDAVGLYDCGLPQEPDCGAQRRLPPSAVLGMWVLLAFPIPSGCPKDIALR